MIPIYFPYHDDELAYSWFIRLCRANGLDDLKVFYDRFGSNTETLSNIPYDIKSNYLKLLKFFAPGDTTDVVKTYLDTTFASLDCMILSETIKGNYLNNAFHPLSKNSKIRFFKNRSMLQGIRFCRACIQEDREALGYHYIHRSHNIPGVHICHKHKLILDEYVGKKYGELEEDSPLQPCRLRSSKTAELSYCRYAKQLMDLKLPLSSDDICDLITAKARETDLTGLLKPELSRIQKIPVKKLTPYRIRTNMSTELLVILLMTFYKTPSDIPVKKTEASAIVLKKLASENYDLLRVRELGLLELRHRDCGSVFYATADSFMHGWRCPRCDAFRSDQEILEKAVSETTSGAFTLAGTFEDFSKPVRIRRYSDGAEEEFNLGSFLMRYPNIKRKQLNDPKNDPTISSSLLDTNYHKITKVFGGDDLILVSEICEIMGGWQTGGATIRSLIKYGKLHRVFHGLVSFCPDKKYVVAEKIRLKYLKGKLHTYGYITGETFNRALMNESDPERIHIRTTKVRAEERILLKSNDKSCSIRVVFHPANCPINEKNVVFLPVLDNLAGHRKVPDAMMESYREYLKDHQVTPDDMKEALSYYPPKVREGIKRLFPKTT